MIYFADWWSYGDNCILETYNGVLAGDKKINDACIYQKSQLKNFTDSIAKEIIIDSGDKGQITQKNKDDIFLNKKINLDFDKHILFVFSEANVKEIVYSKLFECYLITYNEEPAEANTYSAVLAKKIYSGKNDNDTEEDKSNNDGSKIKPGLDEDNFKIYDKDYYEFKPKFETMNDKPKPKKGKYLKSYNDDY